MPSEELGAPVASLRDHRLHAPLWLLVLVTLSGTLAMHMFVPALDSAARDLHVSVAAIQSTISLYIFGLAVGQLAYGPLSDTYGRRPMLLTGLSIFTIAGFVCLTAPSVHVLIAARFAQALGGCSGLLLGRAIVRDTCSTEETMSRLALLQLMAVAGPGLAPLAGSLIVAYGSWRWIFVVFIVLGLVGLALTWHVLPETRPVHARQGRRSVAADYGELIRKPAFIGCVIGGGCSTSAFYAFVASAPFIFVGRYHEPVTHVGVYLFLLIIGISIGYSISGRLARRVSAAKLMLTANALTVLCSAALLIEFAVLGASSLSVVATMFVYCVGAGMCSPVAVTKAMSIVPSVAGSASGIFGFGQMTVGAICTALAGLGQDHAVMTASVLLGAALLGQVGFRIALAEPRAGPR